MIPVLIHNSLLILQEFIDYITKFLYQVIQLIVHF